MCFARSVDHPPRSTAAPTTTLSPAHPFVRYRVVPELGPRVVLELGLPVVQDLALLAVQDLPQPLLSPPLRVHLPLHLL